MITQQTPFLLKILSGSNAGALVRLKVGEVVIGRAMSSDIILHDESIADTHLRLKVSGETIMMEILVPPVQVDNREIDATELVLKPFQVVTLGAVDFFIADVRKPGRRAGSTGGAESSLNEPIDLPNTDGSDIPLVTGVNQERTQRKTSSNRSLKKRVGKNSFG